MVSVLLYTVTKPREPNGSSSTRRQNDHETRLPDHTPSVGRKNPRGRIHFGMDNLCTSVSSNWVPTRSIGRPVMRRRTGGQGSDHTHKHTSRTSLPDTVVGNGRRKIAPREERYRSLRRQMFEGVRRQDNRAIHPTGLVPAVSFLPSSLLLCRPTSFTPETPES